MRPSRRPRAADARRPGVATLVGPTVAFLVLVTLVMASFLTLSAAGHAPSNPREMETRLLTDQNDDCGGHGDVGCQGSHDLLALGLRERFEMTSTSSDGFDGTHHLVWSLWLSPGAEDAGRFSDLIRYSSPQGDVEMWVNTTDDETFEVTAAGFVRVDGPYPLMLGGEPDGDRFGIDIVIDRAALDLQPGDALSRFEVEATVDERVGDIMPGTYLDETGQEAPKAGTEQGAPAETVRPRHVLGETDRYLIVASKETGQPGRVEVQNRLRGHHQNVTLLVIAPDGATIGRADAADAPAAASLEMTLEPRETVDVQLHLPEADEGTASVELHYVTDLGGHGQMVLDVARSSDGDETSEETNEGSAPTFLVLVLMLMLGVTMGRKGQRRD